MIWQLAAETPTSTGVGSGIGVLVVAAILVWAFGKKDDDK